MTWNWEILFSFSYNLKYSTIHMLTILNMWTALFWWKAPNRIVRKNKMSFSLLPISKSNFYTDMSTNICFNRPNIFMMSFSQWIPKYIFIPLELFGSQVLSYFAPGVALPKVMWTRFLILTLTSYRTFVTSCSCFDFLFLLSMEILCKVRRKSVDFFFLFKNYGGWKQNMIRWLH